MYFFTNIFNYFTSPPKPIDPKLRIDFTNAFDNEEFTKLIDIVETCHGRDLDFVFPKTSLGITQALYVGSIHGHYWINKSITEKYSTKEITLTNVQIGEKHTNNRPYVYVWKLSGSSGIPDENYVYHVHLSNGLSLTNNQIENLKEYWKIAYGKTLVAIVYVHDINNRDDIYDMRGAIYSKLNTQLHTKFNGYSTQSVSVNSDCSAHSVFRAGSTFRHHGRTKDIIYIMFNSNDFPCEIRKVKVDSY